MKWFSEELDLISFWNVIMSNIELNIKPIQREKSFISLLKLKTKYRKLVIEMKRKDQR